MTDAAGRYSVSGLVAGSYSLSIYQDSRLVHTLSADVR